MTYQQLAKAQALRYLRHRAQVLAPVAVAVARRLPLVVVDHTARRNARRRAKTAARFTQNHQAATLAWWGPPSLRGRALTPPGALSEG